jgi:hypothetical protein
MSRKVRASADRRAIAHGLESSDDLHACIAVVLGTAVILGLVPRICFRLWNFRRAKERRRPGRKLADPRDKPEDDGVGVGPVVWNRRLDLRKD